MAQFRAAITSLIIMLEKNTERATDTLGGDLREAFRKTALIHLVAATSARKIMGDPRRGTT